MARDIMAGVAKKENEPEVRSQRCTANGCPLVWTCSDSIHGATKGTCTFHDGQDANHWGTITRRIRQNIGLYQAYRKLISVAELDFFEEPMKFQIPAIPIEDCKSCIQYKTKVFNDLSSIILKGLNHGRSLA